MEATPFLEVADLHKAYGTPVLVDVQFNLRRGEVHALVGENGAGKSTLSRIIAGLTAADAGHMTLDGQPYRPKDKRDAERHGIRMVMQELKLVSDLTVAENIFIERLPNRLGFIDRKRLRSQTREILATVGMEDVDPDCPVGELGVGQQQLTEIAAGLSQNCDVLILDEPTAALTDPEIERLFAQIDRLKKAGTAIVYISHRMEEIRRIADRISVLRDGRMIATRDAREVSLDEIVNLMVGRDLDQAVFHAQSGVGEVALRVKGMRRGTSVRDVSFQVSRGEILGFAGLMGAGRTETMRAVFAADQPEAGSVYLGGSNTPLRLRSPRDAVRHGIALLTEDRKQQGLLLSLPIRANITLACLAALSRMGWISEPRESVDAQRWAEMLGVRCSSVAQNVGELSGGNQQKVVIAKWLLRNCDVLIFDEPTRGIDVGAKFEIYRLLRELAGQGKAIIMVSSDLKELLALCDRIAVMSTGRIAATFSRGEWTQDKIMTAALSGHLKGGQQ